MTFSMQIMAREIAAAASLCSQVAEKTSNIPILKATRIDASSGQFMATNAEQTIMTRAACEGAGILCVDTSALLAKVSVLPADKTVEFKGDGKSVTISCGRTRWAMPCLLDDFPEQKPIDDDGIDISGKFMAAIEEVCGVIDHAHTMIAITGVLIDDGRIIATDAKRIRRVSTDEKLQHSAIVPGRVAGKLAGMFPDGGKLRLSETRMSVETDSLCFTTRLVDGTFPEIQKVIAGTDNPHKASVQKDDLLAAIKRAGAITESGEKSGSFINMQLAFGREEITVLARNRDGEEGLDACPCQADAEASIGFNGRWLISEIESLESTDLFISYGEPSSPIIIQAGNSLRMIMPRIFA